MQIKHPSDYKRRILLAVSGLSPQVVSETVFALSVSPGENRKPFVPTEIHVLTSELGATHIRLNLLSDEPGWFHRLRHEYELPEIKFDESTIHIIKDPQGRPLEDIRTREDNQCVADQCAAAVQMLTADEDSALHVSLAGGRKTMGFYLGYALSLFGRPQDALSHVLVSAPFESHPDFYYPSRTQRVIQTRGDKPRPLDCRDARVELATIPFVRMRDGLDERLLAGGISFSESIAAAQSALRPPELVLDLEQKRVRAAGRNFPLPPAELALLAVFARRAAEQASPLPAPKKDALPDSDWAQRYLTELQQIVGELGDLDATERALRNGMDQGYFSQHLTKLRRHLKQRLGPVGAVPYCIDDGGTRPRRYRLALPPSAVRFEHLSED